MATVNLAAAKIANVLLGWPMWQTLLICAVLNVAFAATSGLWGVLVTDFIQFGIAMAGSFAAAYFALQQPRGRRARRAVREDRPEVRSALLPDFGDWGTDARGADHPAHRAVVVGLVSGRGAGRRQLHRAAHAGRRRREKDALAGTLLLQRRALRAAAVAVDHRRARVDARLSRSSPTSRARSRTSTRR